MNTEWIPVTEKLPECGGDYLVTISYGLGEDSKEVIVAGCTIKDKGVVNWCFKESGGRGAWRPINGGVEGGEVVAWMPPPREYLDNLDFAVDRIEDAKNTFYDELEFREKFLEEAIEFLNAEIESIKKEMAPQS